MYQADGTYFYMAHLSAFAGQKIGQEVKVKVLRLDPASVFKG